MTAQTDKPNDYEPPAWAVQLRDDVMNDPRVKAAAYRRASRDMPSHDGEWTQFVNDIDAVLTVYDAQVEPENRGPWRDRLVEFIEYVRQGGQ